MEKIKKTAAIHEIDIPYSEKDRKIIIYSSKGNSKGYYKQKIPLDCSEEVFH